MATPPEFPSPSVLFAGTPNYIQAEIYTKQLASYINQINNCLNCPTKIKQELSYINFIMNAMRYDGPEDLNNIADWQQDIKAAYTLLYQLL